jgi:hypothetical protein
VIPGGPVRPVCPRSPFSPFAHAVSAKGARKARTAIETRIQVLHSPPTEPREGAFSCIISCDGARALVETAFTGNGEFVASGPDHVRLRGGGLTLLLGS